MVGAIAVTEPDAGSDVASIRTRAEKDGDDYIINGSKIFITNGTQADWLCLLARTSNEPGFRGMSLIIVPTNSPGFSVGRKLRKLGNCSSDTGELFFDHVRVPQCNRIGPEGMGFILQMQQFQRERLVGSIMAHAGSEKTVRDTIAYTSERGPLASPLIENQWFTSAGRTAQRDRSAEAVELSLRTPADGWARLSPCEASMAKLKAGRLSREVTDSCLQYYGGMG